MTSTEHDRLFEAAMELRARGELAEARALLRTLLEQLGDDDKKLRALSHLQLGHIASMLDEPEEAAREHLLATLIAPKLELASLALFHAHNDLARGAEALREMLRFLRLRGSGLYRELAEEGALLDARRRGLVDPALLDEIEAHLARWLTVN
jgi:hypothetical protein